MAATTRRKTSQKTDDLIARLADAGEEALHRLTELPGGQKALSAFNDLRNRVDELGKRVRGIEELEARVAKLEKELAALKKTKTPRSTSASRTRPKRSPSA